MAATNPIFGKEIFRFFRELSRNNKKVWMDANRERYQETVVLPFRRLCEELSPAVLKLDPRFDAMGRRGTNFSRINRDIRFAKDKTLYRTQMYLKFSPHFSGDGEIGQLYTGISADTVTVGFRIYSGSKRKESALGRIAEPRALADPSRLTQQKKRLARRYESYWYSSEKGEWKKHDGWPVNPEDWKKIQGWVVRRKFAPAAATRVSYPREAAKIFRELFPLLRFTSLPN
jgi:uncharacterized protein (TIGR02453 family)